MSSSARTKPLPWLPPSSLISTMRSNISMGSAGRRATLLGNNSPRALASNCSRVNDEARVMEWPKEETFDCKHGDHAIPRRIACSTAQPGFARVKPLKTCALQHPSPKHIKLRWNPPCRKIPRAASHASLVADHFRRHRRSCQAHAAALAVQPAGRAPVAGRHAHPRHRAQRTGRGRLRPAGGGQHRRARPRRRTQRRGPARPAGAAGLLRSRRRRRPPRCRHWPPAWTRCATATCSTT